MNRINQESLVGKSQSSHSSVVYDCELPPDVRTELVAPRRPRILGHKTQSRLKPPAKWPLPTQSFPYKRRSREPALRSRACQWSA
jgi:hypothetical protein